MAYDCESAKADLLTHYGQAYDGAYSAYFEILDGYNEWNYGTDHDAIGHLLDACTLFFGCIWKLCSKDTNYDPPYLNSYLWEYGSGAVTWEAIVEAWISNDFEGRAPTIAVIDRMRQILWDEPFRVTWAARPEIEID